MKVNIWVGRTLVYVYYVAEYLVEGVAEYSLHHFDDIDSSARPKLGELMDDYSVY